MTCLVAYLLPWVVFAVYLGLMVRRGKARLGRAVALFVVLYFVANLLKVGSFQFGLFLMEAMFPPGHFPQGPNPIALIPVVFLCPLSIDVPLLLVLGAWIWRHPILAPESGTMSRHDGPRDRARP